MAFFLPRVIIWVLSEILLVILILSFIELLIDISLLLWSLPKLLLNLIFPFLFVSELALLLSSFFSILVTPFRPLNCLLLNKLLLFLLLGCSTFLLKFNFFCIWFWVLAVALKGFITGFSLWLAKLFWLEFWLFILLFLLLLFTPLVDFKLCDFIFLALLTKLFPVWDILVFTWVVLTLTIFLLFWRLFLFILTFFFTAILLWPWTLFFALIFVVFTLFTLLLIFLLVTLTWILWFLYRSFSQNILCILALSKSAIFFTSCLYFKYFSE